MIDKSKFPSMSGDNCCSPEFPKGGACYGGGGIAKEVKLHKIYCDTVADMPAGADLDEGMLIETAGYYEPFDGGGANYVARFVYSLEEKPWVIDLGPSKEIQEQLVYGDDGKPVKDEYGNYVFETDNYGNPVYAHDSSGNPLQKHLYACITEKVINYRMFGAKLDGVTDDEAALVNAHAYQKSVYSIEPESGRKRFIVSVENHEGTIHKGSNNPIICAGNIDLSGSKLVLTDDNAAWYGFYLWGDNEEDYMTYEPTAATKATYKKDNFVIGTKGNEGELRQNALLNVMEDPYAVRDDAGYLYSVPRYELLLHTTDGVLANPFQEDWHNAGGEEISAPFSDYQTHELKTDTLNSAFTISYTRLPVTHYRFIGCVTMFETSANKYCTIMWCKCHNAHISGFTFYPDTEEMSNTVFKNTMIYIWGSYNAEVSNIVGFNAAGKKYNGNNATSGYVIRATNCLRLKLRDISVQGYWGSSAMNCVKDIHIERVSINRLDIHNYFYNLFVDQCNLYNHSIQIGEGRGIVQVTNTNLYINPLEDDSYPNAHFVEFNLTYGRMFEGKVLIENCNVFIKGANGNEFHVFKMDFSPEAVSILPHFKFPEVTVRNCHFFSYDPDTYLVYFMVAGKRNCKTSGKSPTNIKDYCRDTGNDNTGTLFWKHIGRGVDWFDNGDTSRLDVVPGQFVRTYESYLNNAGKTVFYNHKYFVVTEAGTLPTPTSSNKPTDTTGNIFTCGTAKLRYVENAKWDSNRDYTVGDCCYTETSSWLPVGCFKCITAGHSNGYKPVHNSGTVIDGVDVYPKNLDAVFWQYIDTLSNFVNKMYSPNMNVSINDILYADHRLYKVTQGGKLRGTPPVNTPWEGTFEEGTATLQFIGKDWAPKTWWAVDHYCVSNVNGVLKVYKAVNQDGITSGDEPVPGNGCCVDGDIIWENTEEAATKQWEAYTQFYKGDIVSANGNNYKCVFDGRLEMPHQIVLEDISTNMNVGGDIFEFLVADTNIPTKLGPKGKWAIRINNVEFYRFREYFAYFQHMGNPPPIITIDGKQKAHNFNITDLRADEVLTVLDTVVTLNNAGASDWDSMIDSSAINSAIGINKYVFIEYAVWIPKGNACASGPEFIIYTARGQNQRINALAGTMHLTEYDNGKLYTAVVKYKVNANASEFPFYKIYGANSGEGEIKVRLRISNITAVMTPDVVSQTLYPWD